MTSKRLAILAGILAIIMVALLAAAPAVIAQATDTPTMTPTLGFTETPHTRATPTPWVIETVAAIDQLSISDDRAEETVDTIINAYNFVNQNGIVDFIMFIAMSAFIFLLVMRFFRSVKAQS